MKTFFISVFAAVILCAVLLSQTPTSLPNIVITPTNGQQALFTDAQGHTFEAVPGPVTVTFMASAPTPTPTPSPTPTASATPTPTPAPTPTPGPGIQVACPLPNQTYASPVSVVAHATPLAGHTITAIALYVDGNRVILNKPGADINQAQTMASGARDLAFVAWDETGQFYKTEFNITVK